MLTDTPTAPHTLAVYGLFAPGHAGTAYVYDPLTDGTTAPFADVPFGLTWLPDRQVAVGAYRYTGYAVYTPASGRAGGVMPVPADSPYLADPLDLSGDRVQQAQQAGAAVLRRLMSNLHVVAEYRHPNFNRSLLAVARAYVPNCVLAVGQRAWEQALATNKGLADAVVGVLTAAPTDLPAVRGRLGQVLVDLQADGGLACEPLAVELAATAVGRLRTSLRSGLLDPAADPVLFDLAATDGLSFLSDWTTAPESLRIPGLTATASDGTVPALFKRWATASDAVSGFVRAIPQHFQTTALIASKYRKHDFVSLVAAAVKMHQVGVAEQRDPTPAESPAERAETRALIRDASLPAEVAARLAAAKLGEKTAAEVVASFQASLDAVLEAPLTPPTAFTVAALSKWLRELFVWTTQVVGGKVGQLLQEAGRFAERMEPLHRRILAIQPPAGEPLTLDLMRADLAARCTSAEQTEFLHAFLPTDVPAGEDVRRAVKRAFVRKLAEDRKTQFAEGVLGSLQTIGDEVSLAGHVHRVQWQTLAGRPGCPGLAGPTVGPESMAWDGQFPADAAARQADLAERVLTAATADVPASVFVNASAEAVAALPDKTDVPATDGTDRIGTFRRDGAVVEYKPKTPADAPRVLDPGATVGGRAVAALMLRGLDVLAPFGQTDAHPDQIAAAFTLAERTDRAVHARLRTPAVSPTEAELSEQLRRARLATVLAEYVAAAPPEAGPLGLPDVSRPLGLLLDFLRHAADERDGEALYACEPSDHCTAGLAKVDLSKAFPMPTDDATPMTTALNYLYDQCDQLGQPAVRTYLRETRELLAVARGAARQGVRLVLLNTTVRADAGVPALAQFGPVKHAPTVAVLTHQAFPDPAAAAADLDVYARRLGTALTSPILHDRHVPVPVLMTGVDVGGDSAPLPVLDARTFTLPRLAAGQRGLNQTDATRLDTVVNDLLEADPRLMTALAALAGGSAFGRFAKPTEAMLSPNDQGDVYHDASDAVRLVLWNQGLGVDAEPGAEVARTLHRAWTAPREGRNNPLFEVLTSAVLVSLAAAVYRRKVQAGEAADLTGGFGDLLAAVLADPTTAPLLAGLPAGVVAAVGSVEVASGGGFVRPVANSPVGVLGGRLRVTPRAGRQLTLDRAGWMARFKRS